MSNTDSSTDQVDESPIILKIMTFKKQLKFYLEMRELTATQLAKKASVPKQSVSGWLAGSNPRDIRQVKRVAQVLGTTLDHLMFGNGRAEEEVPKVIELSTFIGDEWVSGIFEVRFRRIKS